MDVARISPETLLSHADFVRALARRLLRDAHAAEDVAQDTLAAALDHPPRSTGSLRTWLGRVAQNFARQAHRKDGRQREREAIVARGESLPGPEHVLEREAARAAVVRALLDLPEATRAVLILHVPQLCRPRASASAASFDTVFQLRAVPRVPSAFSITAFVSRERPWPSGYTT